MEAIKELWMMTNAILVMTNMMLGVIAVATILLGYWLTQMQPQPVPVMAQLGHIKRRVEREFTILTSGCVRPDKRTYMVNGEAHYLPVGMSIPAGRRVALVMFQEGR